MSQVGLSAAAICHTEDFTIKFVESFSVEYWPEGDLSVVSCRACNPASVVSV